MIQEVGAWTMAVVDDPARIQSSEEFTRECALKGKSKDLSSRHSVEKDPVDKSKKSVPSCGHLAGKMSSCSEQGNNKPQNLE